jgi:glycosyltransferase involved in cell wall biosynthesis
MQLSVVIPTYNGAERLRRCLDGLSRQTLPPDNFETIVVVDGSTDDTARVIAGLNVPFRLVVIQQPNQGAAAARNAGIGVAQGLHCLFLDDDLVAQPKLLAEHLRVQREHGGVVGLGAIPTVAAVQTGWLQKCFAEDFNEHYARLASGARSPSWRDCYGGNLSVPRAALLSVGGFASDMRRGHDVELGFRLSEYGLAFVFIATASGTQELHKRADELVADFENYGRRAVEIYRHHPATLPHVIQDFTRQGAGPAWFRRLLLTTRVTPHLLVPIGFLAWRKGWRRSWYSLMQNYCYWRGVRRALADPESWWPLTHSTPILKYRAFTAAGKATEPHLVPIGHFARHIAWLRFRGYRVLSLRQYLQYQRQYALPPKRSIIITIDDGQGESVSLADQLLCQHGLPSAALLVNDRAVNDSERDGSRPHRRSGVNNHTTPPQALYRTEIDGTDSLLQFAWKVSRASSGTPRPMRLASVLRALRHRIAQVSR